MKNNKIHFHKKILLRYSTTRRLLILCRGFLKQAQKTAHRNKSILYAFIAMCCCTILFFKPQLPDNKQITPPHVNSHKQTENLAVGIALENKDARKKYVKK